MYIIPLKSDSVRSSLRVNDNPAFKAPPKNYFNIVIPSLESVGAKVIAALI